MDGFPPGVVGQSPRIAYLGTPKLGTFPESLTWAAFFFSAFCCVVMASQHYVRSTGDRCDARLVGVNADGTYRVEYVVAGQWRYNPAVPVHRLQQEMTGVPGKAGSVGSQVSCRAPRCQ